MRCVAVKTGKPYEVRIEQGLLRKTGDFLRSHGLSGRIALISDDRVFPLHGAALIEVLSQVGFQVLTYTFPNGEQAKTMGTVNSILEFLAENSLTRSDCIVALGGGVVGDIAGFCAAIYLRGIRYVQLPTTLLAAIDSSVGGKTGVDLSSGKNLAGAFWQPEMVLCDPGVFATLPEEVFNEGVAEAVKYGVIADPALFTLLSEGHLRQQLEAVIERCVGIKSQLVSEDEFDCGKRQLLNFGHTIGHAVEKCSHFQVRHGQAVAIGMVMMAELAWLQGWSEKNCTAAIRETLLRYQLPVESPFEFSNLVSTMRSDKKRKGGEITLVIPERIGVAVLKRIPVEDLAKLTEKKPGLLA
ncbi:MAG: 3-dehydroquinate synthase [Lentisphaeria bacterium]